MKGLLKPSFYVLCFLFLSSIPAYAYLDAGTGSIMIQVLTAAFLGALVAVKMFWKRIKTFFKSLFSIDSKHERTED